MILKLPLFSFCPSRLPLVFAVLDPNFVTTPPFDDLITTHRWATIVVSDFLHRVRLSKYFQWLFYFLLVVYEIRTRMDSRWSPDSSTARAVSVHCAISLPLTVWLDSLTLKQLGSGLFPSFSPFFLFNTLSSQQCARVEPIWHLASDWIGLWLR